ncbi:sporulation protein YjcZ [Sedimentibacter sp. MB35-C1]|nr:sporulation protein YjcZ [Sedimentibacter sp. MB35-C1]WMJ75688.1 sporulation protein YjcZ [Sedimentibacter sp. MB35-C1]
MGFCGNNVCGESGTNLLFFFLLLVILFSWCESDC